MVLTWETLREKTTPLPSLCWEQLAQRQGGMTFWSCILPVVALTCSIPPAPTPTIYR